MEIAIEWFFCLSWTFPVRSSLVLWRNQNKFASSTLSIKTCIPCLSFTTLHACSNLQLQNSCNKYSALCSLAAWICSIFGRASLWTFILCPSTTGKCIFRSWLHFNWSRSQGECFCPLRLRIKNNILLGLKGTI